VKWNGNQAHRASGGAIVFLSWLMSVPALIASILIVAGR
jgi:hypothetical protein